MNELFTTPQIPELIISYPFGGIDQLYGLLRTSWCIWCIWCGNFCPHEPSQAFHQTGGVA